VLHSCTNTHTHLCTNTHTFTHAQTHTYLLMHKHTHNYAHTYSILPRHDTNAMRGDSGLCLHAMHVYLQFFLCFPHIVLCRSLQFWNVVRTYSYVASVTALHCTYSHPTPPRIAFYLCSNLCASMPGRRRPTQGRSSAAMSSSDSDASSSDTSGSSDSSSDSEG
jgi:hypothetical protein